MVGALPALGAVELAALEKAGAEPEPAAEPANGGRSPAALIEIAEGPGGEYRARPATSGRPTGKAGDLARSLLGPLPERVDLDILGRALRKLVAGARTFDPLAARLERTAAVAIVTEKKIPGAAGLVDAAFASERPDEGDGKQGSAVKFPEPEPWPEPVDLAATLDGITEEIASYLAIGPYCAELMALWAAHAHVFDAFNLTPYLGFNSPTKECGKTRAMQVLGNLVPKARHTMNPSGPALFRTIELYRPTLLIDEADSFLDDNSSDIINILLHGYMRGGVCMRCVGDDLEPRDFTTFCPKAIAWIGQGKVPDTVISRTIVIRMQRRGRGDVVKPWRFDRPGILVEFRHKLERMAMDHLETLRCMDPDVPEGISNDRSRDKWRVLLAIADLAGRRWPKLGRKAALHFSGASEEERSDPRELMLADVWELFHPADEQGIRRPVEKILSQTLAAALKQLPERPWSDWCGGKGISANQVSRTLSGFGIHTKPMRKEGANARGFLRAHFAKAWDRYRIGERPADGNGSTPEPDTPPSDPSPETPEESDADRVGRRCRGGAGAAGGGRRGR